MEKEQRSKLQKATQDARRLLEEEFSRQLLETYDINVAAGRWSEEPGTHLQAEQRLLREKLLAWIEHRSAQINDEKEALLLALREMAFTALNRFVALKLMEARELVRPCVSGGLESEGFQEFTAVAQGLLVEQESSYRLYLETIFEDVSRELRALFDPRDPASLLWPKRTALLELLDILNRPELAELWREDETLGWIYQYFNGNDVKEMRDAAKGGAPRNSRELAVRNQFFTPRYVVEFLTDNTLGRIWYEMRQGDTGLKESCRYLVRRPNEIWLQAGEEAPAEVVADEALSQEALLRQPVHIPSRQLKDPREIRMLDPACGSMHFGLYAFDLYLAIYEEAWEIAQGLDEQAKQGEAFAAFVAFAAGFAGKAAFLHEVPRLILLHNIHGVDIDARATQIARLTLWLRAQRAWQEQQLEVAARPAVTRSNVVCAEPMPGERELLSDFVDQQFPEAERGLVQQLLEAIFDKMQLAGEAGSLLKIEEEIRDAIDQARREWQKLAIQQRDLFSSAELAELGQVGFSLNTDLQNLTRDFWITVEERIYDALRVYANQAERGGGIQRRLFAEDAARGFAFISLYEYNYDIGLMNPPFGAVTPKAKGMSQKAFPDTWKDAYGAFIERLSSLVMPNGLIGAVTPNSWQYSRQLTAMRSNLTSKGSLRLLVELGQGVMDDATVEASIWTASPEETRGPIMALDLLYEKAEDYVSRMQSGLDSWSVSHPASYAFIEGQPLCHHLDPRCLSLWEGEHRLSRYVNIAKGNTTFDDFRFVRICHEVNPQNLNWMPYRSGGVLQPFYSSTPLRINWFKSGGSMRSHATSKHGSDAQVMQSSGYWFKAGISYPRVGSGFAARLSEKNEIFSGNSIYISCPELISCFALAGILNSSAACALFKAHGRFRNTETIAVKDLPFCLEDFAVYGDRLDSKSREAAALVRGYFSLLEEDPIFDPSAFLASHERLSVQKRLVTSGLHQCLVDIDCLVNEVLNLQAVNVPPADSFEWEPLSIDENEAAIRTSSFLLGCLFGRWDIDAIVRRLDAGGCISDDGSNTANPFTEARELLNTKASKIVENGFCLGIELAQGVQSLAHVFNEAGIISSNCLDLIAEYTQSGLMKHPEVFFERHLSMYSESRRSSPIYWFLGLASNQSAVWLYYHSASQDTLYGILNNCISPSINELQAELASLDPAIGSSNSSEVDQRLLAICHLKDLYAEIAIVAPLWNPNLNDGVIINHAILWRITPYTPWQKKCKECWDKLVKGDYDWAHLAFHLWPERVIRKCTTDRSLAIAHGLGERLWQETSKGNWLQRQLPEAELQALLAEYSKPAVQNALERFLAAPPPVAAARTRAPRTSKSSSTGTTRRPRGSAPEVDAETSRQTLLVLTAAPADGLGRNAIAELLGVEAASLTAVIKQLKEGGQIEQLGAARGAKYRLTEQGRGVNAAEQVDDRKVLLQ